MSTRTKLSRDAFGFSLKGLRTMAAYATVMPVADDGINAAWDEKLQRGRKVPPDTGRDVRPPSGRFWLSRHYRTT